jgi:hypothetical protein
MGPGITISRIMTILRHQGSLTLVNSIRLDETGLTALEALGSVDHLIKIGTHGMDDPFYVDRCGAKTWALPGAKWHGLTIDNPLELDAALPVPWLDLFIFDQTTVREAALIAERGNGLLITCDSVQHWPDLTGCSFLAKSVTQLMGFTRHPVVIGPPWRKRVTPAGGSLEPDFRRILEFPFDQLVGGHGAPLMASAKAELLATVDLIWPAK